MLQKYRQKITVQNFICTVVLKYKIIGGLLKNIYKKNFNNYLIISINLYEYKKRAVMIMYFKHFSFYDISKGAFGMFCGNFHKK